MSGIAGQELDPFSAEGVATGDATPDGTTTVPPEARATELPAPLTTALELPSDFRFDAVAAKPAAAPAPTPALGPLAHFKGTFRGNGFNEIFRPDNPQTPTPLPIPVGPSDNILELNLTHETLSFSPSLGSVPNRGSVQADAFLNGVPYLQTINDVTSGRPVGIHFEPGLWVIVPPTKDPLEGSTLVRMASIPHGTTINAQGTFKQHAGAPQIGKADITPFVEGNPGQPVRFPSQQAGAPGTPRIPQDLTSFHQERDDRPGHPRRSEPGAAQRDSRSQHPRDQRHHDLDLAVGAAVRRGDRQHRFPVGRRSRGDQRPPVRTERPGSDDGRHVLDRDS